MTLIWWVIGHLNLHILEGMISFEVDFCMISWENIVSWKLFKLSLVLRVPNDPKSLIIYFLILAMSLTYISNYKPFGKTLYT